MQDIQDRLNKATTKQELYEIAGELNNKPEHIKIDKVTCIGFFDFEYAVKHVQRMIDESLALK